MSGQDEKPFAIPKELVWQAWKQVKANGGAAGADGVTVEGFEKDLKDNLYISRPTPTSCASRSAPSTTCSCRRARCATSRASASVRTRR